MKPNNIIRDFSFISSVRIMMNSLDHTRFLARYYLEVFNNEAFSLEFSSMLENIVNRIFSNSISGIESQIPEINSYFIEIIEIVQSAMNAQSIEEANNIINRLTDYLEFFRELTAVALTIESTDTSSQDSIQYILGFYELINSIVQTINYSNPVEYDNSIIQTFTSYLLDFKNILSEVECSIEANYAYSIIISNTHLIKNSFNDLVLNTASSLTIGDIEENTIKAMQLKGIFVSLVSIIMNSEVAIDAFSNNDIETSSEAMNIIIADSSIIEVFLYSARSAAEKSFEENDINDLIQNSFDASIASNIINAISNILTIVCTTTSGLFDLDEDAMAAVSSSIDYADEVIYYKESTSGYLGEV